MNLVYKDPSVPIRVLMVNPVGKTTTMVGIKLLRGIMFGVSQLIDLILLVYENEYAHADRLRWELEAGGFPCYNSITITHVLPTLSDADIFIFTTSFTNLNALDGNDLDRIDVFNTFYLLMTVASNLEMRPPEPPVEKVSKKRYKEPKKTYKPIIVTDGLLALDIVRKYSKNLPDDIFFCGTPIAGIALSILGDHLKVNCGELNHVHVWAANDDVFHIEVEAPIYIHEKTKERRRCEWQFMAENEFEELSIDFIQFNAAWLKKDFIEKVSAITSRHPCGFIYKASKITSTLTSIWATRCIYKPADVTYANLGIISDGSLHTIKGLPYFLPVIIRGETVSINTAFKDSVHLKQEIKRINKTALANHKKLMSFCKKFYENNVLRREFIPPSEDSSSFGTVPSSSASDTG